MSTPTSGNGEAMSGDSAAYPAAAMELKDISSRLSLLEKRQRWMNAGLAAVVLIAVGWPIALASFAMLRTPSTPQPDASQLIDADLKKLDNTADASARR